MSPATHSQGSTGVGEQAPLTFERFAELHRHLSPSQRERLFWTLSFEQRKACWDHLQSQLDREREAAS